jgi:hypothetical protein
MGPESVNMGSNQNGGEATTSKPNGAVSVKSNALYITVAIVTISYFIVY